MNVSFGSLAVGAIFHNHDGLPYKKLSDAEPPLHNAQLVGGKSWATEHFNGTDRVFTPEKVPRPIFWRRWLLARALRWQMSGFTGWARWAWRLARLWSRGDTEMRLAAYATQLMMMGE